jgi:hypothetical protein
MLSLVGCGAYRPPPVADVDCVARASEDPPPPVPLPSASAPAPAACPPQLARRPIWPRALLQTVTRTSTSTPRQGCLSEGCWYHAGRAEWVVADGAGAWLDVERPSVPPGAHSVAEIAVRSSRVPKDSIEIGWSVSPALHGDGEPHLFVHRWIAGEPCTGDCGWRQRDERWAPGISLAAVVGRPLSMGWQFHQGRWWAWVEDAWIGYFDDPSWADVFSRARLVQWFGEVFAAGEPPAVPMGNGRSAADPAAARFRRLCLVTGARCSPFSPVWAEVTTATLYSVEQEVDGFRYGGPGEPPALTPRPPPSSASGGTPPATGR